MPGPGLDIRALGGVKVASVNSGTQMSADPAIAAYGAAGAPAGGDGLGSGLSALSPTKPAGLAVTSGVVAVGLLILIYHSLPK